MGLFERLKGKSGKDIINKFEYILSRPRIRFIKTLYINFRCLPLRQAIKLPIIIRGRFKLHRLGTIIIDSHEVYNGMIQFGEFNNKSAKPTKIVNFGTIIFHGKAAIWEGVLLEIGRNAILDLGTDILIGENVNIMLRRKCRIGNYARIAFDSQIMDSDFHYMLNMENNEINDCTKPVVIGDYNWIGNRTTIKKGAKTPDFTIVAAPNALLSKDYTLGGVDCPILAGCPAKIIGSGRRRIYSFEWEQILSRHFEASSIPYIYKDNGIDPFLIPK